MAKYIGRFLVAYIVSLLVSWGMLAIAFANWLFSTEPRWFLWLVLLAIPLPYFLLGLLGGHRRGGSVSVRETWLGFCIALSVMLLLGLATVLLQEVFLLLYFNLHSGLVAASLAELAGWSRCGWYFRWGETAFRLAGSILMTALYHIGWRITAIKKKPNEG